jgi:starch synthase (maltosyl-transferring)
MGDPRRRVVIENIQPQVDGGAYPAKAIIDDRVAFTADIFADGHDALSAVLQLRHKDDGAEWQEVPLELTGNDHWHASFAPGRLGMHEFRVAAWVDPFKTWAYQLGKRVEAGQDVATDLLIGAALVEVAVERAEGADRNLLAALAGTLSNASIPASERAPAAMDQVLAALMAKYPDRSAETVSQPVLRLEVDPIYARFSAWYEMFPRSASPEPGRHGTFDDCIARLPYIKQMGFDVLYLPPIHPIGRANRKGKNNSVIAQPDDVGSPWAIGSAEGGHRDIHPELGTLDDFRRLVSEAREQGIEVAMDIAFQCAPDHPYVKEHPEWFRRRPDGTVQHAENPPKKYEDIVPFDFDSPDSDALVDELIDIVRHWAEQGVRIFRVDNPHTKPFALWERLIPTLKSERPGLVFLAEAFTRPKVMYRLAKTGFSQSYTYFAWRNSRWEIASYLTEITRPPVSNFFRPNLWPNTPDILTEYLQTSGRAGFMARLALAATLGTNYGIYGPAFELLEWQPARDGSEEYLDSEKYQLRHWDLDRADSLRGFIARINRIRHEHEALRHSAGLVFHNVDNPEIICYSKRSPSSDEAVLVAVNLDPHHTQSGWVTLDLHEIGIEDGTRFQAHDLLTDARYLWHGRSNYVELSPGSAPVHIFAVRKYVRTEHDFDYYM